MLNKIDQKLSGIAKKACIVAFSDAPPTHSHLRFLYGVVVEDFKGRFEPGNEFRSSPIVSVEGDIVKTQNSIYQVQGDIEKVKLPFNNLYEVLQVLDPRIIRGLLDKGFTNIEAFPNDGAASREVN